VKGVHLEGLRVIGDPHAHALRYYEQGADEILYLDIVASLYGRNNLTEVVERTAQDVFVPVTVGGGVRTLADVQRLLRAGADKVAVNTAAVRNPAFIREAARAFGSQCVVVSIEAIQVTPGHWEALTDNGRERTGLDAVEWVLRATDLGAGEILLTSVDREGTKRGFDIELTRRIATALPIPVVASGGAGSVQHVAEVVEDGRADAVAIASLFHYGILTVASLKSALKDRGVRVTRSV
jgi:cyclase